MIDIIDQFKPTQVIMCATDNTNSEEMLLEEITENILHRSKSPKLISGQFLTEVIISYKPITDHNACHIITVL